MNLQSIEQQLITFLQQGDKQAIRLIYQHYRRALFGVIMQIVKEEATAEDVLQESLVKIWQKRDTYSPDKGRIYTWMLNICRNSAIDKTRSKHFQRGQMTQSQDFFVSDSGGGQPQVQAKTDTLDMRSWVDRLQPEHREIISLLYFKGYTHQEASDELGLPLGTVKSRVRKALQVLRTWMSQ